MNTAIKTLDFNGTGIQWTPIKPLMEKFPCPFWQIFTSVMLGSGVAKLDDTEGSRSEVLVPLEIVTNFIASSFFTSPAPAPAVMAPYKTYLMRDGHTGLIKIGRSSKPGLREKTLQGQAPLVELIGILDSDIEDALHKAYAAFRVRGEWFRLDNEQVAGIIQQHGFA